MKSKPPYLAIAETLREKILSGSYAMGKIPSERALIRQHGVSRSTATKALAALEGEGLIIRRRGSGAFVKPAAGTSEATYVSTLIADMDVREFFSTICGAIAESARSCNLNLIWGARQEFNELAHDGSLDEYIERCRRANIRGVFFVPQDATGKEGVERRNREIAETLRANGITVVLIDRDIVPFPRRSDFDFVGIDNVQAGYAQAKHLIECGCRRLAYVSHDKLVWTVDARYSGFRNAIEECGLRMGEMHRGDPSDPAFVRQVERERPDGIAFVHDDMAIAFMATRSRLYKRKVRHIGLDDIEVSRHLGLTTLHQPARFIGEEATRIMALRLGHDTIPPRQVLFSATLMPRASTLAP